MNRERYEEHVIYSYTRICGYYENEKTGFSMQMLGDNNNGPRYFYVIKVKNEGDLDWNCEPGHKGVGVFKSYIYYIEGICSLISLIYGKTFSYLGILKNDRRYNVLDFSQSKLTYDFFPWDVQKNRVDITEDINLVTLGPLIEGLMKQIKEDQDLDNFLYIVSFYRKGIINSQIDIEISYIDFIRSIEILHNIFYNDNIEGEDIYEGKLLKIREKIKNEPDLAKYFKEINGSTRKFLDTILANLVISDLYNTKSTWNDFSFKYLDTTEKIKKSIKNAYAIRSGYIHSGKSFGYSVLPDKDGLNELINTALLSNSSLKIQVTLSLLGLERIVRNVLLNYYDKKIKKID